MAAYVHPISVEIDGTGNAANAAGRLHHERADVGLPEKLQRGREPRRSGPDDYGGSSLFRHGCR